MALKGVKEAADEMERKRSAAQGNQNYTPRKYVSIKDGEEATVRFLEQGDDFKLIYVHGLTKQRKDGTSYWTDVVCLDQEDARPENCPGCKLFAQTRTDEEPQARRRAKFFINTIWRNAPHFKRDEDNKVVQGPNGPVVEKHEDAVAIWTGGITVANQLDKLDSKYKGITSRDFTISRSGSGTKTSYTISIPVDDDGDPVNGGKATKLSKADEKLIEDKYDLDELTQAPDPGDFFGNAPSNNGNAVVDEAKGTNPFLRKRS